MSEKFAEAIGGFAESTKEAITSMGVVLENHDEVLEMLTELTRSLSEWTAKAQEALLANTERMDALERKVEELTRG